MKKRIVAALMAAFFMLPVLAIDASAGGWEDEPLPEPVIIEVAPGPEVVAVEYGDVQNFVPWPFTPGGTGTVVDNATDRDGKEFFTIATPDGNVFYLVIDRQRGMENVYFLNAVTEADLLSLAELPERYATPLPPVVPEPPIAPLEYVYEPEPTPTPIPEPEPKQGGGIIILLVVVLLSGVAGWYFKVYRPGQQKAHEEFDGEDFSDDFDLAEGPDSDPDYDGSGWDSEDAEPSGDGEDE